MRIDRAKRALARGASVTEACMDVGFTSLGSFSRMFAERVGDCRRTYQEMPYGIEAVFRDDSCNFWSMGQKKS